MPPQNTTPNVPVMPPPSNGSGMGATIGIIIVVLLLAAGGAYFFYMQSQSQLETPATETTSAVPTAPETQVAATSEASIEADLALETADLDAVLDSLAASF